MDFGTVYHADTVEIVCFAIDEPVPEVFAQEYTEKGTYSADLIRWQDTEKAQIQVIAKKTTAPVVKFRVHTNFKVSGKRVRVRYKVGGEGIRYFRLPMPMDRIYAIRLLKDGRELALENPRVSNLQSPYGAKKPVFVKSCDITLQDVQNGEYLAVALNGVHGEEGAYCVAELDGQPMGFPDRAPAYQSNIWERSVCCRDRNYTYYLPLNPGMNGKTLTVRALFCNAEQTEVTCDLWRCPRH